jgi:hypothetical protein
LSLASLPAIARPQPRSYDRDMRPISIGVICLISFTLLTCTESVKRRDQGSSDKGNKDKSTNKDTRPWESRGDIGKRLEAGSYVPCGPNSSCDPGYACDSGTNECRPICTAPTPPCNQQVSPCKATEPCLQISSFSAVCAPGKSTEGQNCVPGTGPNCQPGLICMDDNTCHRVCQINSTKTSSCTTAQPYCSPLGGGFDGCWVCTKN